MHTPSEADTILELVEERYKKLKVVYPEKAQDELIEEALSIRGGSGFTLADCGVDKRTVKNHLNGRRTSTRRKHKRRPV